MSISPCDAGEQVRRDLHAKSSVSGHLWLKGGRMRSFRSYAGSKFTNNTQSFLHHTLATRQHTNKKETLLAGEKKIRELFIRCIRSCVYVCFIRSQRVWHPFTCIHLSPSWRNIVLCSLSDSPFCHHVHCLFSQPVACTCALK